jgi:multiple sugar transport system substrate-binding protein
MKASANFKKLVLGLTTLLFVNLLLGACGSIAATPTPLAVAPSPTIGVNLASTATAQNPVTITWSFWGDDSEIEINKKIIAQFEAAYPNIKVKPLYEKWQDYFKRFLEPNSQEIPDVMFVNNVPSYASRDLLENLDSYVKAQRDFKAEDFYPLLLDTFRYKGALHGIPRDNDTKVVYVNLDMLKEAGLAVPKAGWTWQDLTDYARKLTKRDTNGNTTRYGYAFELNQWWKLWVWQNGGEIYDSFTAPQPPSRVLVNSPEAIEGVQFFADLINKEKVAPPVDLMDSGDKIAGLFAQGKLAMAFGNHAVVPNFSAVKDLKWDVVPLPKGKKQVNVLGGAGYSIHKKSQHKTEAWIFLRYLTGEFGQTLFADTGVMVAARQSIRENSIFLKNQRYNVDVFIEETRLPTNQPYPYFTGADKIIETMDTALKPVWEGKKTAAEVFSELPKKVDPLLVELRR